MTGDVRRLGRFRGRTSMAWVTAVTAGLALLIGADALSISFARSDTLNTATALYLSGAVFLGVTSAQLSRSSLPRELRAAYCGALAALADD